MIQQSKEVYRNSCKDAPGIPIFHHPEWLDIACGAANWEVVTWHNEDHLAGALPYRTGKKFIWKTSLMPVLTPYLGVWVNPNIAKNLSQKKVDKKIEAMTRVVKNFDLISFRNIPGFTGNLNLLWDNWELESKYTLCSTENAAIDIKSLDVKLRNHLKKANSNLKIEKSDKLEVLFELIKESFDRNKEPMPFNYKKLAEFHQVIKGKKWGEIYLAKDKKNKVVAGSYFIWDDQMMYNWLSGYKKTEASRGAVQTLLYNGLQNAIWEKKKFDFEGGIIPGIGTMFKSFPVKEVPVITSRKFKNKWIKALWSLR